MSSQRWFWVVVGIVLVAPPAEAGDQEITLTRRFGIGARAMGMGGAATAVVEDGSALFLNPAGLARVRRIELAGSIHHQSYTIDTQYRFDDGYLSPALEGSSVATRLGSVTAVYPFPSYRGSLVAAGGVSRVFSSDIDMAYRAITQDESYSDYETYSVTGGVSAWGVGGAVDISPGASVGLAVLLWDGHDDVIENYDCETCNPDTLDSYQLVSTDYSALSAILGFQFRAGPNVSLGATIESPIPFTLEGSNQQSGAGGYYYYSEEIRLPFSFVGGAAMRLGGLTLAGDVRYTDWQQINYKGILRDGGEFRYRPTTEVHLGAEYLFSFFPLRARAGWYTEPLAYRDGVIEEDRSFLTFGAGTLIDDVLAVDAALVLGDLTWTQDYQGRNLYRDESFTRVFVSTAYRF
jgi:long-subunit fatty acid transport protein